MTGRRLPADLADAFDWTAAAGELDELTALVEGPELNRYCAESAANNASDGDGSVTAGALFALWRWLQD